MAFRIKQNLSIPTRWTCALSLDLEIHFRKSSGDVSSDCRKLEFTVSEEEGWIGQVSPIGHTALHLPCPLLTFLPPHRMSWPYNNLVLPLPSLFCLLDLQLMRDGGWGSGPSNPIAFLSIKITKETKATEIGRRRQSTSTPPASGNQQEQRHPGMVYSSVLGVVNGGYLTKPPFRAVLRKI